MLAGHGGESEEQVDKEWTLPCFSLLEAHKEFLSRHDSGGKASTEGPD